MTGDRQVRFRCEVLKKNLPVGELKLISCRIDCQKDASIHRTASFVVRDTEGLDLLNVRLRPVMGFYRTFWRGYTWAEIEGFGTPWAETGPFGYPWLDIEWYGRTWEEIEALGYPWEKIAGFGKPAHGIESYRYTWYDIERLKTESFYDDYSLGVFLPLSPTRTAGEGVPQEQIDAYDLCAVLREDCLTERLYLAAGTRYTDAVESLIIGAGIEDVEVTPSDKTLRTDREFEIGLSKLDIINELLEEITYKSAEADENGVIVVRPYTQPVLSAVRHEYRADHLSVLRPVVTESADYYNVPNVFIAVVSNSDIETDLVSVYTNDDPASRLSTVNRGRKIVSEVYQPDGIASQIDLDAFVARMAFEASQIEQSVEVSTALTPGHGVGDIVLLDHPEVSGVFEETAWSMELSPGGTMTHTLRRIVTG